jgi:16S rRNA (guanine527-N7)-methyltransferase
MTPDRISELLSPFLGKDALSPAQIAAVETYLSLLLKWNAKINLTAVREPDQIITRHFGESFFAARNLIASDSQTTALDIGSGAGFPGLPLKLWAPALKLTMVEANQRKATFLRELVRSLGILGVEVISMRAEEVATKADIVTLRAVEKFSKILPLSRTLVNPNGRLAILISGQQIEAARTLVPNLRWSDPVKVPLSADRILLVGTAP